MTKDIRDQRIPIKVSIKEKEVIEKNAEMAGMTSSAFLRNLGCGYNPKSQIDNDLILSLAKINADQGRLGGLMKWWLSGDKRFRTGAKKIEHGDILVEILEKTKETQKKMLDILEKF